MSTKATTIKKAATVSATSGAVANPSLPKTLETLQFLRTAKNGTDTSIHKMLDQAYVECKKNNIILLLERVMLHIGDVSRQHNILSEMGIKSDKGGAQERKVFRSCMRWWEKNMPESFEKNLRIFAEFTLYENLMYYQNTTDRNTGKVVGSEMLFPMPSAVHNFLAGQIRIGKDLNLIAKHLPKVMTGKFRVTKKLVKAQRGVTTFHLNSIKLPKTDWVKVNGVLITDLTTTVNVGDVICYPRKKQEITLQKQEFINKWITDFCNVMDWTVSDYKKFRVRQDTPEQLFSSKLIERMPKSDFEAMLDRLTSGQRFRVAKMIAYKDEKGNLQPREKWGRLGEYYIGWEKSQEKIAQEIRVANSNNDEGAKKELMKQFKVKGTGIQTIDLLAELFKGNLNNTQIDNTYQAMVEKMDLIANVFPIVDGSNSMNNPIYHNGTHITFRQIVYAMTIAFSTRNPVTEFRNTFGWFSSNFHIVGHSKYKDLRPNPYLASSSFTKKVENYQVLSELKTFTENFNSIKEADPKSVSSTNMFSSIEFFVGLVKEGKFHVEDLPQALLYLTDNENNEGKSPKEAIQLANSIGWKPLLVFWGITGMSGDTKKQMEGVPNCLFVGGFSESALSQILRGIKTGSVDPEMELWSIYEDKRYSVLS
jgi:hypothetical protein